MKHKIFLSFVFVFLISNIIAQNYEVRYLQVLVMDTTKNIADGKGRMTKNAYLVGNKEESAYYSSIILYNKMPPGYFDSARNAASVVKQTVRVGKKEIKYSSVNFDDKYIDTAGSIIYINHQNDSLFNKEHFLINSFYTKEKLPQINWQIKSETKKLLEFDCFKATAQFRGREYEAWFTNQVPVNAGPWKFTGLPGLILELKSVDDQVSFSATRVTIPSPKTPPPFLLDNNVSLITFESYFRLPKVSAREYETRQKKFLESMPGYVPKKDMNFGPIHTDGSDMNIDALYFIEKRY